MVGAIDPDALIAGLLGGAGFGTTAGQHASRNLQNQQGQQQTAALRQSALLDQARTAQIAQDAQQQKQYQTDVGSYLTNPTPGALAGLIARYPKQADALKKGWDIKDDSVRRADMGQFGAIYSALDNGKPELAVAQLRQRRDAEKAQGIDTAELDQYLEALQSGDKDAINTVKGFALAQIAAGDRDKFSEIYKTVGGERGNKVVGPGAALVSDDGKELYKAPFAPRPVTVGEGESVVEYNPSTGGGDPASGGGGSGQYKWGWTPRARNGGDNTDAAVDGKIAGMAQALGVGPDDSVSGKSPMDIARALTLSEGGRGSIADRNNNPGNIRGPDGNFKKFPTKEAGLAAAAAQVRRNLSRGQTTIRSLVEGVPAGGARSGGGGARVIAQGAPKQGYQLLTPQENTQLGLDPNVRYQRSPDGQLTALSGQDKSQGQLKQTPAGPAEQILENRSTLREIDRAISLVEANPDSIGFGTGALGQRYTNWKDPKGVGTRAAVGKIGGKIIHDVSGAAVTLSEAPRFQPYVPDITDNKSTALEKLRQLRALAAGEATDLESAWGPDNGYRGINIPSRGLAPVRVRSVQQAARLKPGTIYVAPDGKVRRR